MSKKINPNLTTEQKLILFEDGTEMAGTSELNYEKRDGSFNCANCGEILFDSHKKYNSNSGWPSFTEPHDNAAIRSLEDRSHFMVRTEVKCNICDAHLGHVFPDGPGKNGLRYCINSASLNFVKKK